jgi:hypothetical protein
MHFSSVARALSTTRRDHSAVPKSKSKLPACRSGKPLRPKSAHKVATTPRARSSWTIAAEVNVMQRRVRNEVRQNAAGLALVVGTSRERQCYGVKGSHSMSNPKAGPSDNAQKDPDQWVSGDDPMTGAQASYLKSL